MRVPSAFRELEVDTRNRVAAVLERGKVDLTVTVENLATESQLTVNIPLLETYKAQIEEMGKALNLPVPEDWYHLLLRLPDAMKTETAQTDEADLEAFRLAVEEAIMALMNFRKTEGEKLQKFFEGKIQNIRELLTEVTPYEEARVPKIRARLEEQLSRLESIEYDRGRLEQELIFYIEKLDVTEEKQRLTSHLDYFLDTMAGKKDSDKSTSGEGKKLGFISQEMGREINTLGSKSNEAEMQKIVVKMKDELEQIKEQVLNVL